MANQFIQRRDGQTPPEIKLFTDPLAWTAESLQAEIDVNLEILALSDEALALINPAILGTIQDYKDILQAAVDQNLDILDYFDYDKADVTIATAAGMWMLPEAVESSCGEEAGNEIGLSIDGENSTYWQHDENHSHEIIYRLRSYNKKIEKIRFRRLANARSELENLSVYVAQSLGGLNDPSNLAVENVALSTPSDWNEITFTKKQRGKYVKLMFDSANSVNEARIREIELWVTVDKLGE